MDMSEEIKKCLSGVEKLYTCPASGKKSFKGIIYSSIDLESFSAPNFVKLLKIFTTKSSFYAPIYLFSYNEINI